MTPETILLAAILFPSVGSLLLPVVGLKLPRLRNLSALLLVLVPLIVSVYLIPEALNGRIVTYSFTLTQGFNILLRADLLAIFMAIVSSFISAIIVVFSFDYISHYEHQNEYYLMVVLFLGSMMGICYAANAILLYIFWEITAVTSWRLIGFFRNREYVLRADKAFLVTAFGALAMLIGFLILWGEAGSFDFPVLKEFFRNRPAGHLAVFLILAGILSKSATLPFHTWLPDAGVAPSPVTALLHAAVLVKIGVYVYARIFLATLTVGEVWHLVVPAIALASTVVSAGAALVEKDIKRIIAYSTISQIGFIFFGLSTGNQIGVMGGLLYIMMHGIAKAGLFLSAGIIEQNLKERDITKMGGLFRTMPVTAVSFILCSFSVMGIPPFGGFFSKYLVIAGAIQRGQWHIALAFMAAAFLTVVYLLRLFNHVFLGEAVTTPVPERSRTMVAMVALLAVLSLASGIFIDQASDLAGPAVRQILDIVK